MAGPWEDYQPTAQSAPWDDYKTSKPIKSADYSAGREAPGALRGALSVLNGPTMGFGDEIAGAVGGLYDKVTKGGDLSKLYRENRDYARGAQSVEAENNPWTTGITQAMASAPLGALKLFGAGGTAAMGMMGQASRAVGTGAAYGAIGGAGNSTAEDALGVAKDAGVGAALGGALSGAAAPVAKVIGAGVGNVAQRYNDSAAGDYAKAKIAEAFARDGRGSIVQSGLSNPMLQAEARLGKLGNEALVADAGGSSVRGLLDTMATLPGATKDATERMIRSRQAGSAGRLIGAADNSLGTQGARLNGTVSDFVTQREGAAAPIYQQLHQINIQPNARLQQIVSAADELGATKLGQQMSTAREHAYTLDPSNPSSWAMRDLDHVKQGMDQLIAKQWDTANGKLTPLGTAYQELKTKLVTELDGATTNQQGQSLYKSARDAFAGPSALIDAAKQGQASISKNEAAIQQITSGMSKSELDAYKVGAFEALREKLGRSDGGRTEVLNMWKNPATRDRLKAMFGDELSFRSFAAETAKESRLKLLEQTGRGSQTAARQFAAGDLDVSALGDAGKAISSAAAGNVPGLLSSAANVWNRVKTPEATRDQIGKILLSGGQDGQAQMQGMRNFTEELNRNRAMRAGSMGLLGSAGGGGIIGSGLLGY